MPCLGWSAPLSALLLLPALSCPIAIATFQGKSRFLILSPLRKARPNQLNGDGKRFPCSAPLAFPKPPGVGDVDGEEAGMKKLLHFQIKEFCALGAFGANFSHFSMKM